MTMTPEDRAALVADISKAIQSTIPVVPATVVQPAAVPVEQTAFLRSFTPALNMVVALGFMATITWQFTMAGKVANIESVQARTVLPFIEKMEPRMRSIDRIPDILTAIENLDDDKQEMVSQSELDNAIARWRMRTTEIGEEQTRRGTRITDQGQRLAVVEDDLAEVNRFVRELRSKE